MTAHASARPQLFSPDEAAADRGRQSRRAGFSRVASQVEIPPKTARSDSRCYQQDDSATKGRGDIRLGLMPRMQPAERSDFNG
jgi:hypothetical protein